MDASGAATEVVSAVTPRASGKRARPPESTSAGSSVGTPSRCGSRVRFSHVQVRHYGREVWGGGGVPADDGPPLGLGWDVTGERSVELKAYEDERRPTKMSKDVYAVEGCVEANQRRQLLLGQGATQKQIKQAIKQVVQLNADRWKVRIVPRSRHPRCPCPCARLSRPTRAALNRPDRVSPCVYLVLACRRHVQASEVLFGDAWLFRSQQQAEASELIAMLGLPLNSGARELSVAHWDSDRACAAEVASALGLKLENLMDDGTSTGKEEGDEGAGAGETSEEEDADADAAQSPPGAGGGIRWQVATQALQAFTGPTVLVISCHDVPASCAQSALPLLSRLVGAVAQAHVASHVTYQRKGHVSVVLRGWHMDTIEADWSDEDSDEFCISPLH